MTIPLLRMSEEREERKAALTAADHHLRIEGAQASAETAHLFQQYADGVLDAQGLKDALDAHYRHPDPQPL